MTVKTNPPPPKTPLINYTVTNRYPHDTTLFTEGLLMHNGNLFESTGSPEDLASARSLVGIVDMKTGKLNKKIEIDRKKYFGEGIVILNGKLYQLTYKNKKGFIYDAKTFIQLDTFNFVNNEGWGMTTNGKDIIMSDGTDKLTFLNPDNMQPVKILSVTENNIPVKRLNELEFINGYIYSNIWMTNYIVKIDTSNGKVTGKLDLTALNNEEMKKKPNIDVLNGIAYDPEKKKIYVTGKLWPTIYEIDFPH